MTKAERGGDAGRPAATTPAVLVAGAILLLVALAASAGLVLQSVGRVSLPGCGPESDCARAARSVWGTIGGVSWLTTANVGAAYFLGILAAWIATKGRLPGALRWFVRLGAGVSILLAVVMVANGYVCRYCLVAHVANLAFVVLVELSGRRVSAGGGLAPFAAAFILASVVLAGVQWRHEAAVEAQDEQALEQSTQEIIEASEHEPFTGRYRIGPETAPIRIVIISDYQCPDCKRIEGEVREILASRDDVSFSAKHFPFCKDCNRVARKHDINLHPNACWAARAAEAAGILGGEEGFWRMHHWLFDRGGGFTDAELKAALPGLGFDPQQFVTEMASPRTLELVEADIDEADRLGLRQTPMIFINGVELLGWRTPKALIRAVEQVAATNPPPLTAAADRPPAALEKYMRDWREQPRRVIPPDGHDWTRGPASPAARLVMWGDYREPYTAELDARVRAVVESRDDVSYSFRHYPIDQSCNPTAARTLHPDACRASKVVEAAGRLGGLDAYWRMHAWVLENQSSFNDASIRAAARGMGLDPDALFAEMEDPEVAAAIVEDAEAAKRLFLRGVPFFFVNGRQVPFWRLEGERLPERIIEEAATGAAGAG